MCISGSYAWTLTAEVYLGGGGVEDGGDKGGFQSDFHVLKET